MPQPPAPSPPRTPPSPIRSKARVGVWLCVALVLLALLGLFLGGGSRRWSEGVLLVLIGLLMVLRRPPTAPPRPLLVAGALLNAWACWAFFPAHWFALPAWRAKILGAGVILPATVSPQPWLTFEAIVLLLAGTLWLLWLFGHRWHSADRSRILTGLAGGFILLAGLAFYFLWKPKLLPSFWTGALGFGPFPNHNQFANVMALGGILALACAQRSWNRSAKTWLLWLLGYGVLLAAVIEVGSRAGVILLLGGSAVWIILLWIFAGSIVRLSTGFSAIVILVSLFVLFGGSTLERFHSEFSIEDNTLFGLRELIFQDARRMLFTGPAWGIGLGNFRDVFPFFRDVSRGEITILHPESDWLWAGTEMGWLGLTILGGSALYWLVRVFPLAKRSDRRLRSAALVVGIGFFIHGFVDVSGHAFGSILPALLIMSLAPARGASRPCRWGALLLFRGGGVGLIAMGAIWIVASAEGWMWPGALAASLARERVPLLVQEKKFTEAIQVASVGLRSSPLDTQLYFLRATARAGQGDWLGAIGDFRVVRTLQPFFVTMPLAEARVWAALQPALAVPAWLEALRRAPAESVPGLYGRVLAEAGSLPQTRTALRQYARGQPPLLSLYLQQAPPAEVPEVLSDLLASDPFLEKLTDAGKVAVFGVWARLGEADSLERRIMENPDWLRAGWILLARRAAARSDFERACLLAFAHLSTPALPAIDRGPSLSELQRQMFLNPNNFAAAYGVYVRLSQSGSSDQALETLRRVLDRPEAPVYFSYLAARLYAERHQWPEAWHALEKSLPPGS